MAARPDQVIEEFAGYFNAGDIDGILSLYEPNATFIPAPRTVIADGEGLRAAWEAFDRELVKPLAVLATTIIESGDLALSHTHFRGERADGDVPMEFVSAEVIRRQADGAWKYVIDNPFGGALLS